MDSFYFHGPLHSGLGVRDHVLHALLPLPPAKRTLHVLFQPDISCANDSSVYSGLTQPSFSVTVTERHSYWRPAMEQPGCFPTVEFDRSKLMIRIEVTLNADPTAIGPVVEGIMEMARRLECAAGKEFEIETALREALANAIIHGCKNDPIKKVQCCVGCDDERGMLIVVRDPGSGFDPFAIPDPCRGENIYSNHGRGIYLINQLMDEVKFERNGTEIQMRKY